eukprot:2850082-Rhodomonas_salina.3
MPQAPPFPTRRLVPPHIMSVPGIAWHMHTRMARGATHPDNFVRSEQLHEVGHFQPLVLVVPFRQWRIPRGDASQRRVCSAAASPGDRILTEQRPVCV